MIIKCEKCQTKFRLDDSKVTDRGVKVRCTKCKHVFRVHKENTEELSSQPVEVLADSSLPVKGEEPKSSGEESIFSDESAPNAAESFLETPITTTAADTIVFDSSFFDDPAPSFPAENLAAYDGESLQPEADDTSAAGGEIDFSAEDMFGAVAESA